MNIDSDKLLELAEKMRCTDDRHHSEYRRGTAVASDMLKDAIHSGELAADESYMDAYLRTGRTPSSGEQK